MPTGASYNLLSLMRVFISRNNTEARMKPKIGDSSRDFPMLAACAQSTPLVPPFTLINWFAIPTPMIEPISVCELEAGNPKYQVPKSK